MCGSEELIHDARQVDLEDVIMTNETPMYLVPGKLTDEQAAKATKAATRAIALGRENSIADFIVRTIGTPIQPCADVETVANAYDQKWTYGDEGSIRDRWEKSVSLVGKTHAMPIRDVVPLVRRTDMEAQIARVVAEKDAEIARLNEELSVYRAGFSELLAKEVADLLKGGAA